MKDQLLDIKQLSGYLGISVNTLYSWVSQKRIPHIKMGRLVRFDLEIINKWLEEHSFEVYSDM